MSDDLDDLTFSLVEHFAPVGPVEEELVAYLTLQLWRLARVYRVETGILAWYLQRGSEQDIRAEQLRSYLAKIERERNDAASFDILALSEDRDPPSPKLVVEPDGDAVVLEEMVDSRYEAVMGIGAAFVKDASSANALAKLSRYETTLLRGIERALDQLRKLKDDRLDSSK